MSLKHSKSQSANPRTNHSIRVREVRTIDEDGSQLGILPTREALRLAQEKGLDLVEVQANQRPPVCKIMDFGKFKYDQKKRANEAKKKQTVIELKEMKFRPRIDKNDYETKVNHIRRFISDGNRCRAVIMFRGREMVHTDIGRDLLVRIAKDLEDVATVESSARLEGRNMSMILVPAKK